MKLKEFSILVALLLAFVAVIVLCIIFPPLGVTLLLGFTILSTVLEIRAKHHKLTNILRIIGFFFLSISVIIWAFWPKDANYQGNLAFFPQALGMVFMGIALLLNSRAAQKSKDIFAAEFSSYFKQWYITLPEENLNQSKAGTINKSNWLIKFSFGKQNEEQYLEVYAVHPGIWHKHFQILETGEIKKLPAFDDLQGITEAQLTADLRKKDLYPLVLNPWLVSYIAQNQPTKSRYEIDKYLLESGYTPGEIERAWDSLAPTAI